MEKGLLAFLKKSSKTVDRFTAISDLQNYEEPLSFTEGLGKKDYSD